MVETLTQLAEQKTFKREVALAALVFWAFIAYRMFFVLSVADIQAYSGIYGSTTMTIWAFAAAAFGLDQFVKMRGGK